MLVLACKDLDVIRPVLEVGVVLTSLSYKASFLVVDEPVGSYEAVVLYDLAVELVIGNGV